MADDLQADDTPFSIFPLLPDRASAVEELAHIAKILEQRGADRIWQFFPPTGPYRRALYGKHLEFFAAGKEHRERLFLKANRVGGSEAGAFEMTLHLTGDYDTLAPWWQGRRFTQPVKAWVAGDTAKTARDILQDKLLGPLSALGTGMIPKHLIASTTPKAGVPEAIENIWVKHVSGDLSLCQIKSFDQKREAFQGTSQHVIWLDEECPNDIYTECLLRTADTPEFEGGLVMLTFTPLQGLTELVLSFLPGGSLDAAVDLA